MNKLSKIFLVVIIILVIALGIMTYLYVQYRNSNIKAVEELYKTTSAIENTGLELERQEDNTYILVEREIPVERVEE